MNRLKIAKKLTEDLLYRKTGKRFDDLTFENFIRYLYTPTDPASLGVSRMLFGIMMVLDASEERGGAEMDIRWGDPQGCHFPLIPIEVLPLPYMALIYAIMWFGAIGIALGYNFRRSALMFSIPYWYIFLLDKSFWNNHSYLFGLVGILLIGTQANNFLSLDAYYDKSKNGKSVPYWNYFILKYQFFILYFVAGLKKSDNEWLSGYAMTNLSAHWVFNPFKIFLSIDQVDYFMVHWFAFIFDLTVCFWMMYEYTRPIAMFFCAMFHLMNSRLFTIGMFPWVCLSTMPLFCPSNWPRIVFKYLQNIMKKLKSNSFEIKDGETCKQNEKNDESKSIVKAEEIKVTKRQKFVAGMIIFYMVLQAFLPYSHFITKGYNNWTNGLYGYSWDMMVNKWDTILVMVKVVDNDSKTGVFLDPDAWTNNDRWSKHGDMLAQYAQCIRRNLLNDLEEKKWKKKMKLIPDNENDNNLGVITSSNISIYVDVWCSMNGRFQQRMFDPTRDLLTVKWSPFENVDWLMPLLTDLNHWRETMNEIQNHVYTWNNYSDVLFIADFPGLHLENYITPDLSNVTLTVLEGQIYYDSGIKNEKSSEKSEAVHLTVGERASVIPGIFHRIYTVGESPACYMYTYMNSTLKKIEEEHIRGRKNFPKTTVKPKLPLLDEFLFRLNNMGTFLQHIGNAFLHVTYGVPMMRRIEIR